MASDDEVDYMSDDFLNNCVGGSNDCRPGLLTSHAYKRKIEMERKKKECDEKYRKKMKPLEEIQKEKLKEGLETPIDASNKGFALMQKMGYKSGMSLGKQGNGIVEPVGIVVKSDRIGIGWQRLLKEKRRKIAESRNKKNEMDPFAFRAHKSNLHQQKKIEADLYKSRKACYNLDSKEGILKAHEYWFWPEQTWENEEYDEEHGEEETLQTNKKEKNSQTSNDKLSNVNNKLSNVKDKLPAENDDDDDDIYDEGSNETLESPEQLQVLTSYLRDTYFYCVWCCTAYETLDDLETHCPGSTRHEHDD